MQNREDGDQRSDFLAGRPDRGYVGPGKNPLPTLALLLTGTVMLGAVGGWFLSPREAFDAPVVAMLSPEQLADAIPTLNAGAQATARSDQRECRFPFGFITVATPGNPAGGTVSFRTSKYQSPAFHVTDKPHKPQQIAIPSPLPETGGVDLLSADGEAKGLLVSLYPTARMEPVNGSAAVKVIWRPRPPCKS